MGRELGEKNGDSESARPPKRHGGKAIASGVFGTLNPPPKKTLVNPPRPPRPTLP